MKTIGVDGIEIRFPGTSGKGRRIVHNSNTDSMTAQVGWSPPPTHLSQSV